MIALAANPTVIARLTGADPSRVRAVARTASSPAELPPARDLLTGLAGAVGVEGAEHGWSDAPKDSTAPCAWIEPDVDVSRDEVAARLGDPALTILDVRTPAEFSGEVAPCDPRRGHIPGARNLDVAELMGMAPVEMQERLDLPPGSEIVAYCHSGGRSAIACSLLRAAGYESRNYVGSWHEWSSDDTLPIGAPLGAERTLATDCC